MHFYIVTDKENKTQLCKYMKTHVKSEVRKSE